jgi:hypothetical protein
MLSPKTVVIGYPLQKMNYNMKFTVRSDEGEDKNILLFEPAIQMTSSRIVTLIFVHVFMLQRMLLVFNACVTPSPVGRWEPVVNCSQRKIIDVNVTGITTAETVRNVSELQYIIKAPIS